MGQGINEKTNVQEGNSVERDIWVDAIRFAGQLNNMGVNCNVPETEEDLKQIFSTYFQTVMLRNGWTAKARKEYIAKYGIEI